MYNCTFKSSKNFLVNNFREYETKFVTPYDHLSTSNTIRTQKCLHTYSYTLYNMYLTWNEKFSHVLHAIKKRKFMHINFINIEYH